MDEKTKPKSFERKTHTTVMAELHMSVFTSCIQGQAALTQENMHFKYPSPEKLSLGNILNVPKNIFKIFFHIAIKEDL